MRVRCVRKRLHRCIWASGSVVESVSAVLILGSQSQKLDGQAAKAYSCPSYRVGKTLDPRHRKKAKPCPGKKNHTQHSADSNRAKHARHCHQTQQALPEGRVHQYWNQWFTRTKNKNDKQSPRRNACAGCTVVNVSVFSMVAVRVHVPILTSVGVAVHVGSAAVRAAQAPC